MSQTENPVRDASTRARRLEPIEQEVVSVCQARVGPDAGALHIDAVQFGLVKAESKSRGS
jgi:hypothetical protein